MKIIVLFALIILSACSQSVEDRSKLEFDSKSKILNVIKTSKPSCSPYHCIKPVAIDGSDVKALEIIVQSKESVRILTYDENGNPVDLESDFEFKVTARKNPDQVDVRIVKKNSP